MLRFTVKVKDEHEVLFKGTKWRNKTFSEESLWGEFLQGAVPEQHFY